MDKRTYLSYKSEMFAHTAAKRRIANVTGSMTLHPKRVIKRGKITLLPSVASKMRRAHFPNEGDFFSFLSPLLFFSHFLLSFTSLIFFNNSHLYNYVLAIFWLQHIERRLRFFVQQIYLFDKMKYNKAKQNHVFASVASKMRRAHFSNEQALRANEGGKCEFLRERRAAA